MLALRNLLETGLQAISPRVVIFGAGAERLPNTTLFAVEGMKAETAVIAFDLEGIAVSSGAACSSGKVQPSHVLAAMGVSPPLHARRGARQPGLEHDRKPTSKCSLTLGESSQLHYLRSERGIAA